MPNERTVTTADSTVHVIPGKTSWIVTRITPQFNAGFADPESAVRAARSLARRDGALLLVHRASGQIATREDYRTALPKDQSTTADA